MDALLENKREYVTHLCDLIGENMVVALQGLYDPKGGPGKSALETFQTTLATIPKWNTDIVHDLRVKLEGQCTYIDELIKAIFTVCIQVHLIQVGKSRDKIKIRVPSTDVFLHHCLIEFARAIWKKPYLFHHEVRSLEKQRNLDICEKLARKSIQTTIRNKLPMSEIVSRVNQSGMNRKTPENAKEESSSSDDDESSSDDVGSTDEESDAVANDDAGDEAGDEAGENVEDTDEGGDDGDVKGNIDHENADDEGGDEEGDEKGAAEGGAAEEGDEGGDEEGAAEEGDEEGAAEEGDEEVAEEGDESNAGESNADTESEDKQSVKSKEERHVSSKIRHISIVSKHKGQKGMARDAFF
jgi:hypothetical protein